MHLYAINNHANVLLLPMGRERQQPIGKIFCINTYRSVKNLITTYNLLLWHLNCESIEGEGKGLANSAFIGLLPPKVK